MSPNNKKENFMVDRILYYCSKVPAGLMLIPLFIGAILHTFFPQALEIGSFTTAVFSNAGASAFMGLQLLCLGTRLQVKTLARSVAGGALLLAGRCLAGFVVMVLYQQVFGTDILGGVCVVAAICAVSNTNGSIYISLCNVVGKPQGAIAAPILALNNGPMLPLLLLGVGGYVSVSPISILAMLLPMALGMILGNCSKKCAQFLDGGVQLLLPFIGFTLGAGIDLKQAISAGLPGLILALIAILVSCVLLGGIDRFLAKGDGTLGFAACATGANAVAVPAALAGIDPTWMPFVADATAQIATCAVVSALVVPMVTVWLSKRTNSPL